MLKRIANGKERIDVSFLNNSAPSAICYLGFAFLYYPYDIAVFVPEIS